MADTWGGKTAAEKTRENKLRRQAKRLGLKIKKGRPRKIHVDNLGGYMIVDLYRNRLVRGQRFELDLEDVAAYLAETEENLRKGREL